MSEHIPGTWEDAVDLWDENGMLLAKVLKRGDVKERHAMLSAAPWMLAALKAFMAPGSGLLLRQPGASEPTVLAKAMGLATKAIAKAEGK